MSSGISLRRLGNDDAFYKPRDPVLKGAVNKPIIRERTERVYDAFDDLEAVLERELQRNAERDAR